MFITRRPENFKVQQLGSCWRFLRYAVALALAPFLRLIMDKLKICSVSSVNVARTGANALLFSGLLVWMSLAASAQPPGDPAEQFKNMFENFAKQGEQFMPGMFSELTPEQMAKLEKVKVSVRDEAQFGNDVLKNYEIALKAKQQSISRTGDDVAYLKQLVQDVQPQMTNAARYKQMDVGIVQTAEIDAYSIPGGHLLFTSGLLDNVKSEAELVGVIAHELSHLDRGHQLLTLKQSKTQPQWNDPRAAMSWMATMFKPFRPEFEAQADADAVRWMLATGYDARQLAQLLARWEAKQNQQAPWINMMPSFVRSHPDSGRRAQSVLKDFDNQAKRNNQLVIGRKNLEQRIPASQKKMD